MRSTPLALLTVAAALVVTSDARAQGSAPDVRAIKPVVMMLVDTSGSMERMPDSVCPGCLPQCDGNPLTDTQNRWSTAVQALTGTMQGFTCQSQIRTGAGYSPSDYDYGYHLPHHKFSYIAQTNDGILDAYRFRAKFGLMTFDGVGTSIGGQPLVELADWTGPPDFEATANSARGMYSYGSRGVLAFPGCTTQYAINTGARSANAVGQGGLISPGLNDGEMEVTAVNNQIQQALLSQGADKLRPFGGTPIAAMLSDLEYWLNNSPDVGEGNDVWNQCRKKVGVLLTDGRPDSDFRGGQFNCQDTTNPNCPPGGCVCPYDEATTVAARMCATDGTSCKGNLDQLFVVGFSITDPDVVADLDLIADAGGTGTAIIASGRAELMDAMGQVLDSAQPDATSRTLTSLSRSALESGTAQYEVTAGFRMGSAGAPWQGILERRRYTCDGANVVVETLNEAAGDLFHETLSTQALSTGVDGRAIYTFDPGANAAEGHIQTAYSDSLDANAEWTGNTENTQGLTDTNPPDEGDQSGEGSDVAVTGEDVVRFRPEQFADSTDLEYFNDVNNDGVIDQEDIDYIMEWMLPTGGTVGGEENPRMDRPLGAIYHSNPVIMEAPLPNTKDENLNRWRQQEFVANRPPTLFVGSNDGILHAFSLEDWDDPDGTKSYYGGQEMWGFIPPATMQKMASATQSHQILMDGSAVVRDVLLDRSAESEADIDDYRTVLVMALRGTPNVFALDVTSPHLVNDANPPGLLWQFSDDRMGETVGSPAVAQVIVNWGGNEVERTVAIIPGGAGELDDGASGGCVPDGRGLPDNDDARDQINCWKRVGRQLYVVDVATGELIQHFDERHFNSPLTGAVALDNLGERDTANAAYFVDHDGIVWRLYMGSTDVASWEPEPIYDLFYGSSAGYNDGRASTFAPLVTRDPNGDTVIITGTGDMDNMIDQNGRHRLVSITESRVLDEDGNLLDFQVNENWIIKLDESELVTGPLAQFEDGVYFGTFVSDDPGASSLCDYGMSRLWGVHYKDQDPASVDEEPLGVLADDPNAEEPVYSRSLDFTGNAMIMGVQVLQKPSCTPGEITTDPVMGGQSFKATGESGGGGFELRAVVSGDDTAAIEGGDVGMQAGSQIRQMSRKIGTRKLNTRVRGWASSLE